MRTVRKPWGKNDLRPWNDIHDDPDAVGEIWFERKAGNVVDPDLLLKLLFTSQPLSIQVHPDDAYARSMGQPHGKTEAWYILSAEPDAAVGAGLKRDLTPEELRAAIQDGSIADLLLWHPVRAGELVFIPAGTIHSIGAGLVLAEIQQRSDTTFRLFDYGRARELHVEEGVAVSHAGPPPPQAEPYRIDGARTVMTANPFFVLERVKLAPDETRVLNAPGETWVLGLEGDAAIGPTSVAIGEAVFLDHDRCTISAGENGLTALCAYLGPEPRPNLLDVPDPKLLDLAASRSGAPNPYPDGKAPASSRITEARS